MALFMFQCEKSLLIYNVNVRNSPQKHLDMTLVYADLRYKKQLYNKTGSRKIKSLIQLKFLGHNPAKFSIHDTVVGRHYLN